MREEEMTHSPLPWKLTSGSFDDSFFGLRPKPLITDKDGKIVVEAIFDYLKEESNMAFIVKAANSYEEHLNILRQLIIAVEVGRTMGLSIEIDWNVYKQAKEAVTKAEEE